VLGVLSWQMRFFCFGQKRSQDQARAGFMYVFTRHFFSSKCLSLHPIIQCVRTHPLPGPGREDEAVSPYPQGTRRWEFFCSLSWDSEPWHDWYFVPDSSSSWGLSCAL
jgi:hypothetical protein